MLSKVAKFVGFVGGIAALVWAVRDRFISVAVSREPEPPAFRSPPTPEKDSSLESINGVGPTYADRLRKAGYNKPSDLIGTSPEDIATIAGVGISRANSWLEQIRH